MKERRLGRAKCDDTRVRLRALLLRIHLPALVGPLSPDIHLETLFAKRAGQNGTRENVVDEIVHDVERLACKVGLRQRRLDARRAVFEGRTPSPRGRNADKLVDLIVAGKGRRVIGGYDEVPPASRRVDRREEVRLASSWLSSSGLVLRSSRSDTLLVCGGCSAG